MYQAIVLLPLLGAILGAAIALAGARARFPGAEPSDDDHHVPAHGQSVHVQGDHAVHEGMVDLVLQGLIDPLQPFLGLGIG